MRYLCKKVYNKDFIVGEYYNDNNLSNEDEGFLIVNGYYFFNYPKTKSSNINEYFYSEKEVRKIKLKKLLEL